MQRRFRGSRRFQDRLVGKVTLGSLLIVGAAYAVLFGYQRLCDANDVDEATLAVTLSQQAPVDAVIQPPFPQHEPSPSLEGGTEWFNTSGPIDLKELRGKFVLLDFWTYCCINCMHILPELKKLERAHPNDLVVIGVHSAKFEAEQDSQNIKDAILRYEIEHPVINDARHVIWDKFQVTSWPSLRLIDPSGDLVAVHSGEIKFEPLEAALRQAIPYYRQQNLLDETPLHFDLERSQAKSTPLRFPGKVLADEASNRLFIADSNHNRIVVSDLKGKLIDAIGNGTIGRADGDYATAQFDHPQGMALRKEMLYVADTENHLLRKIDLDKKTVTTIAGLGHQAHGFPGVREQDTSTGEEPLVPHRFSGKPLSTALNSPWDLCIHKGDLFIAMAGPHQIWKMPLDESEIGLYAGSGREDIIDGPLLPRRPYQEGIAAFAQPSGLAADNDLMYVADSEGSSIRTVPFKPTGRVHTLIGTAGLPFNRLFTFGDQDGRGAEVRFQHPLGVAFHEKQLYVADTYNNKIKRVDTKLKSSETIAGTGRPGNDDETGTFDEPSGISIAAGKLYVADTNNHLIRTVDLENGYSVSTLEIAGLVAPTAPATTEPPRRIMVAEAIELPAERVRPRDGKLVIAVKIELPVGYKINERAPLAYQVDLAGAKPVQPTKAKKPTVSETKTDEEFIDGELLGKRERVKDPSDQFEIELPLSKAEGRIALCVALEYYYCQEGDQGLCKATSVAWKIPVTVKPDAISDVIELTAQPN